MCNDNSNSQPLNQHEWGHLYNESITANVVRNVVSGNYSEQTREMLKLTRPGERVIEIGAGSGETVAALAREGREVVAVDYSEDAVALIQSVARGVGVKIEVRLADTRKDLGISRKSADVVFQAGLLEHFEKFDRIELLKKWGEISNRVVSLVPNAACIPYRIGMRRMIEAGTWPYGLELPQYTLKDDFCEAGLSVTDEYSIGERHGLSFLPKWDPTRIVCAALNRLLRSDRELIQGYLLVTIGNSGSFSNG